MGLEQENYNSKIKIYYKNNYQKDLAQEIIEYIWFEDRTNAHRFKLVKDDKKGKVYRFKFDKQAYYLKYYAHRRTKKVIKNLFRPVEAIRHFKTILRLKSANIPVIEPVLSLTYKQNLFITDSIFVTKEFEGISLFDYIKNKDYNLKERRNIVKGLGQIWGKLLGNNFSHQDPGLQNFMINLNSNKIVLIDVDNIYWIPISVKRVVLESLVRFYDRSLSNFHQTDAKSLTAQERILFVKKLFKHYHTKIKKSEFIDRINHLTIKRLTKNNKIYRINKDNILSSIYNKK
ncbi:lipopolysaccharide kinase InaA family protein [Halonatronum saccharophilum]|uniref:lipopolysaccharide kinase InaA family protein n=1 Tax=Halonatronum saccharophilum TaxID=150060 RepID=UPI000483DC02|nr:lipopolysaccharide kinase InaA family protein [Halonatronum saccharophilum]